MRFSLNQSVSKLFFSFQLDIPISKLNETQLVTINCNSLCSNRKKGKLVLSIVSQHAIMDVTFFI